MESKTVGFGIKDGLAGPFSWHDILEWPGGINCLYLRIDGSFEQSDAFPDKLGPGEGAICWTDNLAVEPEEIAADYIKSDSLQEWIEFIAVRQFNRMYSLNGGLFVYAERN